MGDETKPFCFCHGGTTMNKIVSSFAIAKSMPDHYNPSTGTHISSHRQHRDELKRQSEARTFQTGIEHNFVPVDPADAKAVYGITEEGLDATRKRHRELGITESKVSHL